MVLANITDGRTIHFDLSDSEAYRSLCGLMSAGKVTALSILKGGIQHSLPRPRRFRGRHTYGAEPITDSESVIGERIFVHVDNVRISISSTFAGCVIRCDLAKLGIMKYNHSIPRLRPDHTIRG